MAFPHATSPPSVSNNSNGTARRPRKNSGHNQNRKGRSGRPNKSAVISGSSENRPNSQAEGGGVGTTCQKASSSASNYYLHSYKKCNLPHHSKYVAMDCEMVGDIQGESMCARVVLLDWKGSTIYDSYVKPDSAIADYRTHVSGIVASSLNSAPCLRVVREQVLELIHTKIVVGHALENDFRCLGIQHAWQQTRDTATYEPFLQTDRFGRQVPRKLKDLVQDKLGHSIQDPDKSHCPIEDAMAAMRLYKEHRPRWEKVIMKLQRFSRQQLKLQTGLQQYPVELQHQGWNHSHRQHQGAHQSDPYLQNHHHASYGVSYNRITM